MQPGYQQRGGASSFNMMIPKDEQCTIAGNKYYIHIAGNTLRAHHVHMRNVLQQITGLDEVTSADTCDLILVICAVVSRAGTDIEAALNSLNKLLGQTDLTVASELMIVLLGISESGKTAVEDMVRKEMGQADVSTAIQNIMVERGTVSGEKENIQFCICMFSSGPYAVFQVTQVKHLTKEEEKIVENMNKILEKSCWERVMVIFSTDDLENPKKEFLIKIKNLLNNCGNRVNFVQTGNSAQVSDMLKKIEEMVAGK
ncbi:hypothetical protein E1301_Tti024011 [Triplophysa tibetana]|uniref:AIG1-type G domain-containing protein n=1 Tax=Triplophysa tibetana TaxID=1572043 RepID=A0A5A9P481_9TELE|nr:hypothetical protein E1301_Tti024011 [Triplophysa tibetana]